jgi:ABC-type multidrug transport system permease subunit
MTLEIILAYLMVVPTLCLCGAYIAPWSIAELPESFSHGEAFRWAMARMFVEKWYLMVLAAVLWLPALVVLVVLSIICCALFATFFKDTLDEFIGN